MEADIQNHKFIEAGQVQNFIAFVSTKLYQWPVYVPKGKRRRKRLLLILMLSGKEYEIQWCLDLVYSDLVNCCDLVAFFGAWLATEMVKSYHRDDSIKWTL